MKFLVTGGAGRLGRDLLDLIASRGDSAVAFDLPQVSWEAIDGMPGVEALPGDITDPEQVARACRGVDAVFHLAALLPPRSEADRGLTMRVNVEGTRNVAEAMSLGTRAPVVFASSISTYGVTADEEPPIGEDHPQRGHDSYSESKIEAERILRDSRVPHVILRIAPISVVDLIELPETIPYRGDQRVEFVFVEDAAKALISAFEMDEARWQAYNIAGGPSWRMTGSEYIERFYGALGVEVEPTFSKDYTAVDWYDTSRGRFLGYQRLSFNGLLERLRVLGERLGLR